MCGIRVSGEGIWRCGKCEDCIKDDKERKIQNLKSFHPIIKSDSKPRFTNFPV